MIFEILNYKMSMLIDPHLLISSGALVRNHEKGQIIFYEDGAAEYYFQIVSGYVAVVNKQEDGSTFMHGIYKEGEAIGTAAVILGDRFTATAVAEADTVVLRLGRKPFLAMLKSHQDVLLEVTNSLCRALCQKAFGIASQGPEERISTLLQVLKKESGCEVDKNFRVTLSRQQIADMIGLRVETAIRAIKKLEEKGSVTIEHGKVYC
jgi:CRP-like cAMP-binding protein